MKSAFKLSVGILLLFFVPGCKKEKVPVLTTADIINITGTTASSGGNITDEGTGTVISRGICWTTSINPTITNSKTSDGAGAGNFTSNLTGLSAATTYFVRAYATNSAGTGYGMAMSFTTFGESPASGNSAATNVTPTSATLNGTVNPNYLSTTISFEYGITTSYGTTVTAIQSPLTGNALTVVSADITSLAPGTIYHYRIKADNSLGTTYGDDMTFTTLGDKPAAITLTFTNVSATSAKLNATVNPNFLSTVVTFEFGNSVSYGSVITASQSPLTSSTSMNANAIITGLTNGTEYHYRVKAENQLGITYGDDVTFMTSSDPTDYDGNVYLTIIIGTQTWMAENLKTSHYNDGSAIPLITNGASWPGATSGGYCAYGFDPANLSIYGALYNWASVNTGKLCPVGWHVPTDSEWLLLTSYLNGSAVAGGKMKETGATHWSSPNTGADNLSGFTALGGSSIDYNGVFGYLGQTGYWWSSIGVSSTYAFANKLFYDNATISQGGGVNKISGCSIRCIKD